MLLAEGSVDPTTWIGIGSVSTVIIGAVTAGIIKIFGVIAASRQTAERTAVADYQRLFDISRTTSDKYEQAKDKMAVDLNATLIENLRLKAMVADRDETIASKDEIIASLKKGGN